MSLIPRATLHFVRREWRYLLFGFVLAFWSSPGQTYVISLFGAEIREAFQLSHGGWGEIYMYATLISAVLLLFAGRLVDHLPIWTMAWIGLIGLGLAAMAFPLVVGSASLLFGFLALRFTGQGMLSHISGTALAREYEQERGRAVALGALGFSVGQAVFPPAVVLLLEYFHWRQIWFGMGLTAIVTGVPVALYLLSHNKIRYRAAPNEEHDTSVTADSETLAQRIDWTRRDVLRDIRFYFLVPVILTQSAVSTAFTFHQVYLVTEKTWSMVVWSSFYSVFAISAVVSNLIAGILIDRFSARVVTPFAILPMALAFLLFGATEHIIVAPAVMILLAMAGGTLNAALGALMVELYGIRHLGAIRALKIFLGVIGSALGPVLFGLAIDVGATVNSIMIASAIIVAVSSGCAFVGLYSPMGRRRAPSRLDT